MYSKVESLFWLDVKNKTLSDHEKLLFLYLLTCPHRNVLGYYIMPLPYISADLRWDIETVKERFTKLLANGYINYDYESEIILINNFLKYNAFENPNQIIGAIKPLKFIPFCKLDEKLLEALKRHKDSMCKGKKGGFENHYETLMQTVTQRVASTVTVTVAVNVLDNSNELSSCPNFTDGEDSDKENTGKKYSHESKYYQAAKWLSEHAIENSPRKMKVPTETSLQKWSNTFRLIEDKDGIPWDDIRSTLKWAVTDSFWRSVILSAGSFREKYNQLVAKMQNKGGDESVANKGNSSPGGFKPSRS